MTTFYGIPKDRGNTGFRVIGALRNPYKIHCEKFKKNYKLIAFIFLALYKTNDIIMEQFRNRLMNSLQLDKQEKQSS